MLAAPQGQWTGFLARFGPDGKYLFASVAPYPWALAGDAAGEFAVAGGYGSAYFAKYDAVGKTLWSHTIANPMVYASGVALDGKGEMIVAGVADAAADLGAGPFTGGFVAKFDSAGTLLWQSISAGSTAFPGLAANGDVIVAGDIIQDWDFGNGLLKAGGTHDTFLQRLEAGTGKSKWSRRFGKTDFTDPRGLAVDGMDGIALGGQIYGSADFGGGLLTTAGKVDATLARFDGSGKSIWSARYGDAALQPGAVVAASATGHVAATGTFLGTIDFGDGPMSAASPEIGYSDIWFAIFPR